MSGPTMHCSIERKFNLGNFQTKTITVGISQVPLHATDAMVADMLKTSATIVEALDRQIEHEFSHRDMKAFAGTAKFGSEEAVSTVKSSEGSEALRSTPAPEPIADPWEGAEVNRIPDESEVSLPTASVFGVDVALPPAELLVQPIEATAPDGGQGKQLKALNASLTEAGFKDGDRHWASLAIIQAAYGGMARTALTSLKDLTKGEAHVILDFLFNADAAAISALRQSTSAKKGQLVIDAEFCDLHPFCEHNWQGRGNCREEAALV